MDEYLTELAGALALCQDEKKIENFLKSILTPSEVQEVTSRWALVQRIYQGVPQRQISRELGLSLCKITRGSRELKKEQSAFRDMMELYLNRK